MKRQDIIAAIATSAGITKQAADAVMTQTEGLIVKALVKDGEYQLRGVGTLKVKQRAARTGRNPQTGAPLEIAASQAVTFSTAKALKEALNP